MQTLKYMENCLNKLIEHYGFNLHEFEKNSSTEKNPTNKKDAVASDIDAEIDVNRKKKKRKKDLNNCTNQPKVIKHFFVCILHFMK